MKTTYVLDVKHGNVVVVWTKRQTVDLSSWNSIFDLKRFLVQQEHSIC